MINVQLHNVASYLSNKATNKTWLITSGDLGLSILLAKFT